MLSFDISEPLCAGTYPKYVRIYGMYGTYSRLLRSCQSLIGLMDCCHFLCRVKTAGQASYPVNPIGFWLKPPPPPPN